MKSFQMLLVAVVFSVVTLSYSVVFAGQNKDAKELFEKKCQQCHELDLPRSQNLDRNGWEGIMNWMTSMSGANISDEEAALIIDYLVKHHGP